MNKIGLIEFFLSFPDVAKLLPCWQSQFSFSKLRQPTGQRQSNIRMQKNFLGQSYYYIMRKVVKFVFKPTYLSWAPLKFHCAHPSKYICFAYIE